MCCTCKRCNLIEVKTNLPEEEKQQALFECLDCNSGLNAIIHYDDYRQVLAPAVAKGVRNWMGRRKPKTRKLVLDVFDQLGRDLTMRRISELLCVKIWRVEASIKLIKRFLKRQKYEIYDLFVEIANRRSS